MGKSKGGGPHNFKGGSVRQARKEAAFAEVQGRIEWWQSLSPKEQLYELDRRLGAGLGATKQRARIAKQLRGAA